MISFSHSTMGLQDIVFIGTSEFADASLKELLNRGHAVRGVVTEHGDICQDTAMDHGIPVFGIPVDAERLSQRQQTHLNRFIDIKKPAAIAMCVWQTMLPRHIVDTYNVFNVHAAPLPKYRGWAPINWQIIHGHDRIGLSIALATRQYDRGDIAAQTSIPIGKDATAGEAYNIIEPHAAVLLADVVGKHLAGGHISYRRQPQRKVLPTAPQFTDEDTRIDWSDTAHTIHNLVRGCNPMEYAHTYLDDRRILIEKTAVVSPTKKGEPGEIVAYNHKSFEVSCGRYNIEILRTMFPNERRMYMLRFIDILKGREQPVIFS
jgi:methionyl-tRNA formyltransferase